MVFILKSICRNCLKHYEFDLHTEIKKSECCSDKCRAEFFDIIKGGFNPLNRDISVLAKGICKLNKHKKLERYRRDTFMTMPNNWLLDDKIDYFFKMKNGEVVFK